MLAGDAMRVPVSSESWVSTDHGTLPPRDPAFEALRVVWYEPVSPPLAKAPAVGSADGTAIDRLATPPPNESTWLAAPRMLAVLRSKSLCGPLAERIPSRPDGLKTPNSP